MEDLTIHIRNMVCPRCIETVQTVFRDLGIPISSIRLGEVRIPGRISEDQKKDLAGKLSAHGFELLTDTKSKLIGKIKTLIIEKVHYSEEPLNQNYSDFLAEKLNHDYTYLSKLFSAVEGITIERFIVRQKIEKVKELIIYNELSLSEIAYKLGYSSVAYLSTQFRNETGMTPTGFKKSSQPQRHSLDSI